MEPPRSSSGALADCDECHSTAAAAGVEDCGVVVGPLHVAVGDPLRGGRQAERVVPGVVGAAAAVPQADDRPVGAAHVDEEREGLDGAVDPIAAQERSLEIAESGLPQPRFDLLTQREPLLDFAGVRLSD